MTPKQQMARLKEAGLNPNLMYGSGTLASKSADVASSSPPSGGQPAAKGETLAGVNGEALMRVLLMHANTENTQANTENLRIQQELLEYEKELKSQAITGRGIKNQYDMLNLNKALDTYDQDVKKATLDNQMIEANIAGRNASTTYTLDQNERSALANSANLKLTLQNIIESKMRVAKTAQEIQNLQKALEMLDKEGTIRDWEISLQKAGITKGGGITANAASMFGTIWNNFMNKVKSQ